MGNSDYYIGQRALIEAEFRLLGIPTDPTIIQVQSKSPTGVSNVYTYPAVQLTRRDVGLYETSIIVDEPGQWHFRIEGAGVVDAVTEVHLNVLDSAVI